MKDPKHRDEDTAARTQVSSREWAFAGRLPREPQAPTRDFFAAESRRPVEERDSSGQFHREAPFILTPARREESVRPGTPPRVRSKSERLHDENARSAAGRLEKPPEQPLALPAAELVHGERRHDPRAAARQPNPKEVLSLDASAKAEAAEREPRCLDREGAHIGARDRGLSSLLERPGGPSREGAAAEVHDPPKRGEAGSDLSDDLAHEQKVQHAVVEGERRPLSRTLEGLAGGELPSPFDIQGGKSLDALSDFPEVEPAKIAPLDRREIPSELPLERRARAGAIRDRLGPGGLVVEEEG